MPVGYFEEPEFPNIDGSYRYMPFRGQGHYQLQVALREQGKARCSYESGDKRVEFNVRSCPQYGVLELTDFERKPKAAG